MGRTCGICGFEIGRDSQNLSRRYGYKCAICGIITCGQCSILGLCLDHYLLLEDRQRMQLRIVRRYAPILITCVLIVAFYFWRNNPNPPTDPIGWILASFSILIYTANFLCMDWIVRKIWRSSPNAKFDSNFSVYGVDSDKNSDKNSDNTALYLSILSFAGIISYIGLTLVIIFSPLSWYRWPLIGFLTIPLIYLMIWVKGRADHLYDKKGADFMD